MNQDKLKKITESLIEPFFQAGKEAMRISNSGVKIKIKQDNSPVTDGDLAVDAILRNNIKKLTPEIPIISEETVDMKVENTNKTFWLIDPIDGTKEYIKKKDEYTINAALIINKKPKLGIIYAPKKNRLFFSYGFNNAYEIRNGLTNKIECKKKTIKGKVFALTHSKMPSESILSILKKNKVDSFTKMSSSYKFCVLASGEYDLYTCEARAYEWDIAAGHAILEHAGGTCLTVEGKEIFYGKKNYKNPALLVKRSNKLFE